MFYINNKKVKEWIVKGEGNDQFLHRVKSAFLNNQEFYFKSGDSEFVNIKVYHDGQRIKTDPQFVKKTELSSTTIRVQLSVDYDLMVSNVSKSYVVDFSGTANATPTFKLDSSITASTIYIYLREASSWRNTHAYSLELSDYNFSSISTSAIGKDCGFDNAQCYVWNGSYYTTASLAGLAIIAPGAHPSNAYLNYCFIDPPEINSYGEDTVRFGYLPKETAEVMGFSSERNPDASDKSSPDYWGWGCWVEDKAWLWSDAELCEIFSITTETIQATSNWKSIITLASLTAGETFHWGVYRLNNSIASTQFSSNPTFKAGIIFEQDDSQSLVSDVRLVQNQRLDEVLAAYYSGENDLILILPFSQPTVDTGNKMSDFYQELINTSCLLEDLPTSVEQFFNINSVLPSCINGTMEITASAENGYLYCGSNIQDNGISVATTNSVSLDVNNSSTSIIYLGARTPSASLTLSFDNIPMIPDWMFDMMSSELFINYKLIPFITSSSIGEVSTDGTINLG